MTYTPKCIKIVPNPNVNKKNTIIIGTIYRMFTDIGTRNTIIIIITIAKDTSILKPLTSIRAKYNINFGKYIFEIMPLFTRTILTLTFMPLEKNVHIANPEKINTGKNCSDALNTTPNINVYISIIQNGSINHHSQSK